MKAAVPVEKRPGGSLFVTGSRTWQYGRLHTGWDTGMKIRGDVRTTAGKFQEGLQHSARKDVVLLFLAGAVFFAAALWGVGIWTNEANALSHQEMLERVFVSLYETNKAFLLDEKTQESCRAILGGEQGTSALSSSFNKFALNCEVNNEIILSDMSGRVLYTSYNSDELTTYLHNYNAAVCYNAREYPEGGIYNAVFWGEGNYGDYMFVAPIHAGGEVRGYLSMFLSGSDWNFYLSAQNYEGLITDMRNNVLYCSRADLMYGSNKFYGEGFRFWHHGNERYWMVKKELPAYGVVIYSLVYYPSSPAMYIGIFVICMMGLFWYKVAMGMMKSMAAKNSERIGRLVSEIRIIRHGDPGHRIEMGEDDEFKEVGHNINDMLDTLKELNDRNIELLKLNNTIEMSQLTAQINPHFLYNTLETIRNLVSYEGEKAEGLIIQLTKILRYSVDNMKKDVHLEEDMGYIEDYLEIQRCRFAERFVCTVSIGQECGACQIPKLLLQPIIENSIKYGFRQRMNLHVEIEGHLEGDMLLLLVADDGPGMEEEKAKELKASIHRRFMDSSSNGLHNIARRLYLQYGEESGLDIENREGVGMKVIIRVKQGWKEG